MSESSEAVHEGGCLCGAIRYRLRGPVSWVGHCHCIQCRRAAGSPAITWLTLPKAHFEVTKGALHLFRSSDHGTRGLCANCGSPITFETTRAPSEVDVTVATLDRPEDFPPRARVWASEQIPWLDLDRHLPSWPKNSSAAGPD